MQQRDEYANINSTTPTRKTFFSWSTGNGDPNFTSRATTVATITNKGYDANGNLYTLETEKHYFYGNPSPTTVASSDPTKFAEWWLGLEYQTDVIDPTGSTLQSTQRAFGQLPCPVAFENGDCPNGSNMTVDTQPAHDPHLCQVNTTTGGVTSAASRNQMSVNPSAHRTSLFYMVLTIYCLYNLLWLAGIMFSYGKNDTFTELLYLIVTFMLDTPIFIHIGRLDRPSYGFSFLALLAILLVSAVIGMSFNILTLYTLSFWYLPKTIPLAFALWKSRGAIADQPPQI